MTTINQSSPVGVSLQRVRGSRPSTTDTDAARRLVPDLKSEFIRTMESSVINRMGVNGLRDDKWFSKLAPEAIAGMSEKLSSYGMTDPRTRNACINDLMGHYNNKDLPNDPDALRAMIDKARKLGDLASYVDAHRKDVAGQVMEEVRPKLGARAQASARKILDLLVEQGIDDIRILRATIAYAYAESGLKMSCISDGGQSIGWFQLGPEVGITRHHRDGAKQLEALLKKRVLDSRAARWLGDYYQKGAKGFSTFRKWLYDNNDAFGSKIAQVFGLCVNPSMATLRGTGRPYANAYKYLFGGD